MGSYYTRYCYDGKGNLIEKQLPNRQGAWHYRWDSAGQLISIKRPDSYTVQCQYDALGRCTYKLFRDKLTIGLLGNSSILSIAMSLAASSELHRDADEPGDRLPDPVAAGWRAASGHDLFCIDLRQTYFASDQAQLVEFFRPCIDSLTGGYFCRLTNRRITYL
ncbi:hypothetical protein ACAW74_23490 [Fibrella sp. WM1]